MSVGVGFLGTIVVFRYFCPLKIKILKSSKKYSQNGKTLAREGEITFTWSTGTIPVEWDNLVPKEMITTNSESSAEF